MTQLLLRPFCNQSRLAQLDAPQTGTVENMPRRLVLIDPALGTKGTRVRERESSALQKDKSKKGSQLL